jgi:hypothetical protein
MATGTVQTVVVCVTASSATSTQQVICPKVGTQFYVPSRVSGYVIDPSQASFFDMAIEPLDVASVGSVWSVGFSFVLVCFLIGRGVGSVLSLIRKG